MRKIGYVLISLLATGCAVNGANNSALFSSPDTLEGEKITECGLLKFGFENHNFYPDRKRAANDDLGVGVSPGAAEYDQLRANHDKKVCLTGYVRYSGCTVSMICTASNFPYEIVVDDIRR